MASIHHSYKYKVAAKAFKDSFHGHAICWLCGTMIDFTAHHNSPSAFSTDHAVAVSTNNADPLDSTLFRPAHKGCNSSRKDKPDNERTRPYIPPGRTEPTEINTGAAVLSETRTTNSSSAIRWDVGPSGCGGLDSQCSTCTGPKPRSLPCQSTWGRVSFDPATGEFTSTDRRTPAPQPEAPAAPEAPQAVEDTPAADVVRMARPASLRLL